MSSRARFLAALKARHFLATPNDRELDLLSRQARRQHYPAGSTIFHEGEPSPGLFWLESGTLKAVKYGQTGREQILHIIQAGQTFNEAGAFAQWPNPATVVALTAASLWHVPSAAIKALIRQNPDFAEAVIQTLSLRLRDSVALIEDLSLRPVISRLARLILDEAQGDTLDRPTWYTQNELAARLGTVADVVQRALRKLEAEDLIQVQRHQIRITNRAQLTELTT